MAAAKRTADTNKINKQAQWANELKQARASVNEFRRDCAIKKMQQERSCA